MRILLRYSSLNVWQRSLTSYQVCNRIVSSNISLPSYITGKACHVPSIPVIHTKEKIAALSHAGSVVHDIFQELENELSKCSTTEDIDDFVFEECQRRGVYPAPLGYRGFPKSVCTSVNQVACHGIPSKSQLLQHGDLISVDISIYNGEVYGDACRSYTISRRATSTDSDTFDQSKFLCDVAAYCCMAGISVCHPGAYFGAIAEAISAMAKQHHCRVIVGIRGHGIGDFLHGPPDIRHAVEELQSPSSSEEKMQPGNVFTIEPCIALPTVEHTSDGIKSGVVLPAVLQDGWSIVTTDGALTAQVEETVLITESGHQVLT